MPDRQYFDDTDMMISHRTEPATDDAFLHIKGMPTDVYMATRRDLEEKFDDLSEESPYKCNLCDHTFLSRMEFERHQNSVHREQQSI
jgi:hypothetical protein